MKKNIKRAENKSTMKTQAKKYRKKINKIRLGVNIDHVATLRQVRGATTPYPDLLQACFLAQKGGAEQITIHLREDRRHIQDADVVRLCRQSPLEINLEMGATDEMVKIACQNKPAWVCFVPEKRQELTTEGGLDVVNHLDRLSVYAGKLLMKKIKVSYFIEPSLQQVEASAMAGADAVEFHTGHWVLYKGAQKKKEWNRLVQAACRAYELGLRVHVGHGLDFSHAEMVAKVPFVQEANIGHSLICYSIEMGLQAAVKKMLSCLKKGSL